MSESKDLSPSEKMKAALPDEKRARRTSPLLTILTGLLAAVLVIGCCVCGIGVWWFRPQIRENPEQTGALTRQIVDIAIPEAFQPHGLIEWNLAFLQLRGVYYQRYVGDGVLTLLEVNTGLSQDETVRNHIRKTLLEEGAGGTQLVIDQSQTHRETFTIADQPVPFTFEIAREGNEIFHLVEGVFPGKNGQVLMTIRVDDVHWRDEADFAETDRTGKIDKVPIWVRRMIDSIGKPPEMDFQPTRAPAAIEPQALPAEARP